MDDYPIKDTVQDHGIWYMVWFQIMKRLSWILS